MNVGQSCLLMRGAVGGHKWTLCDLAVLETSRPPFRFHSAQHHSAVSQQFLLITSTTCAVHNSTQQFSTVWAYPPRWPCFKGIMGTVWSFPLLICEESHSLPWQQRFYFDTVVSCSCPKIEGGSQVQNTHVIHIYVESILFDKCWVYTSLPGLCHYSLHAGSVGLLNTLDTKVRTFSIFSVPTKALYITICHYRPAHCTNMLLFHNATALRSVSILSLLSLPSITRFTWFTSSHDKAYPCS